MSTFEELSTSILVKKLDQPESIIIDVRPIAAYNGWALRGEQRGGHIAGAKSIPLQWFRYMDWVEVLEEKDITEYRPVIIYGYNADQSSQIAEKLQKLGFQHVSMYNGFLYEWPPTRSYRWSA